ncbi:GspH/FimT family pseudopilin [Thiocapsa bogorovii]|uniref:GspH/FimT family pseudopilin n=1 Tax=Thiocapsa bogorovii TaxID=521689 RepID=UPI001E4A1EF2|nr:GspH/FimT family pseudopilin [Thiocapsa bogorovii]UHD15803.1 GspH/FimT family pseudopilin [Thiocapsa bogorovii]
MRTRTSYINVSNGFTLIELMTSLVVLSILLAIGIPSFKSFSDKDRITDTTNDLITAFQLGRSEAIRHRTKATICEANKDQTECVNESTLWSNGWILYRSTPATPIRIGTAPLDGVRISTNALRIVFDAAGQATDFGQFEIDSDAGEPRCIRVLPSGFISSEKMACPKTE